MLATSATAQVVVLNNPSFESPVLASGTVPGITGWAGTQTTTAVGTSVGIPPTNGNQIAYNDSPVGTNFLQFTQTTETIVANQVYNLQVDVRPLVDDPTRSCLGIELTPTSFGLNLATRYWRSANFAPNPPFGPFAGPDTVTPIVGQWNRVVMGFNSNDFPTKIGDRMQLNIRGHKFAVDNVLLIKGARNFYVSFSEGNDFNDGLTPETPVKTFTALNGWTLGPGSQVLLKRGDTWSNTQLTLAGKGSLAQPIVLSAYGEGPNPIITGINTTTTACVVVNNPSHWDINSLDLRDAKIGLYLRYTGGNTDGTGPMFNNANVTVSHMNFQGMNAVWSDANGTIAVVDPYEISWGAGIWVGGSVPSPPGGPWPSVTTTVLDGLTVRHCSFQMVNTGVGNGWYFPGKFTGRMPNILLEDSWVTGCENGSFALFSSRDSVIRRWDTWLGGTGFYNTGTTAGFLESTLNILIEDCEFAGNKRVLTAPDGVGMDFEGDTVNSTFRHNVVHSNDGSGLLILPTQGNNINLQMLSNTFWNNSRNPSGSGANRELIASNNSHTGNFSNNGVYLGTDVSTGLAVYNSTTRWNTLFSANTGGNRTTTSWASVSSRPTAWSFTSSVEGWGNANNWSGFASVGGALVGTSTGGDPFVESAPTWVNTRERRWVLVTMSQTAGTSGQIFFQTEADPTWTEAKSVWFPILADGAMRTYVVDLGQSSEYRGVVTRYRLDPTTEASSQMAIADFSARLDPYLKTATALSPNEIEVSFNQAMLPQSGLFNPANYAIEGPGKGSLANNPTTVTQIPTPNGPVYRLRWNEGGANGQIATITATNVQAARGHAIGPINTLAFDSVAAPVSVGSWLYVD
jgi:hypothetical protein